jgi:hypothetical protein
MPAGRLSRSQRSVGVVVTSKKHRARRPSKREREDVRRDWALEKEDRAWREAQIAELEKQGEVSDAQLEELGLVASRMSPAMKFIADRLQELSFDDPLFDSKWQQVIVDLMASGVPLDPLIRRLIAGDQQRLYYPDAERDSLAKRRNEVAFIKDIWKAELLRGMMAKEADAEIAKELGIKVGALHKKLQLRVRRTKT